MVTFCMWVGFVPFFSFIRVAEHSVTSLRVCPQFEACITVFHMTSYFRVVFFPNSLIN